MNIFTIIAPNMDRIALRYAPGSNRVETTDKIKLIKIVRDNTSCSLKDAKDFVDTFIDNLNNLAPDANKLRRDIVAEIDNITDAGDLLDIKRFVNTCKRYPLEKQPEF